MTLPLGSEAMRRVLDRIAAASEQEEKQQQLDDDVKKMRAEHEIQVQKYIHEFFSRAHRQSGVANKLPRPALGDK